MNNKQSDTHIQCSFSTRVSDLLPQKLQTTPVVNKFSDIIIHFLRKVSRPVQTEYGIR